MSEETSSARGSEEQGWSVPDRDLDQDPEVLQVDPNTSKDLEQAPAPDDGQVSVDRESLDWILGFIGNLGPRRGSLLAGHVSRLRSVIEEDGTDE